MALTLKILNYTVDTVQSGEDAVRFIKKTPVDLVILDMIMDPGINGRQTLEQIHNYVPSQKAILTSGFSKSSDVKATLRQGASGFIKKPYTINQLGQMIKKVLSN